MSRPRKTALKAKRQIVICLEHVEEDIFRAQVFDADQRPHLLIESISHPAGQLILALRDIGKGEARKWDISVQANWTWYAGQYRRPEKLAEMAIACFYACPPDISLQAA